MQNRVAIVQDISGLGRCSLAAALPVLSVMGAHCCPVPTEVFTNQTGFSRFASIDCGPLMKDFTSLWKTHGIELRGIYTGFMSTIEQLHAAQAFIDAFRASDTLLLVDPVMGDDGARYPCFGETFCNAMRGFAAGADVITPNITEACLLTGVDYHALIEQDETGQLAALRRICEALPPSKIVITGWRCGENIRNITWDNGAFAFYDSPAVAGSWSGTGDLFASALCGGLLRGEPLGACVRRAMRFLEACLRSASRLTLPKEEGVPFELHLKELLA